MNCKLKNCKQNCFNMSNLIFNLGLKNDSITNSLSVPKRAVNQHKKEVMYNPV